MSDMNKADNENPTRNERRKAATRAKLLAATRVVVAEKGVETLTIKDITDTADVGFGSFYNHFDTKQEIVEVVFQQIGHELADAVDALNATIDDPVEKFGAAIAGLCRMVVLDPVIAQLAVNVQQFSRENWRELSARMVPDLELGIERGALSSPNADVTRAFVGGALFTFLQDRLAGHFDESTDEHAVLLGLRILGVPEDEAKRVALKYTKPSGDES